MGELLVVVEHRDKAVADVSLEMLAEGRRLARQENEALVAMVAADDVSTLAPQLARWADKVLAVKVGGLRLSLAEPYQRMVASMVRQRTPRLVLIGHTALAMDLAPALAAELGMPLVTDCSGITLDGGNVTATRLIHNGKVVARYSFAPCETVMLTGRPGAFAIEEAKGRGEIEETEFSLEPNMTHKRFLGYAGPEPNDVDIAKAEVVVAVGRGIKDRANLRLAEDLAAALGGMLACSRPVVDYGWLSPGHQVGLSGKTVNPRLYLALGISGAFQHTVGLRGSKMVVAVNKDDKAPIFAEARYGIVGDLLEVVPLLTQHIVEARRR